MFRSFGLQTVTGTAQPAMGDKITAAFVPPLDLSQAFKLTVANSALYVNGDRIILGAGSAGANVVLVIGQPDSTHVLCQSEGNAPLLAWPINTIIALSIACAVILITGTSLAGNLWFGSDATVTNVGGGSAFTYITAGGNYPFGFPQWNTIRSTDMWLAGTASDTFGAGIFVV